MRCTDLAFGGSDSQKEKVNVNHKIFTRAKVEVEVNGMVTYDRRVVKPNAEKMRALARELHEAFESTGKI